MERNHKGKKIEKLSGSRFWRKNLVLKIKYVTYSSQVNHTGQLDFCN